VQTRIRRPFNFKFQTHTGGVFISVPEVLEELHHIIHVFGFTVIGGLITETDIKLRIAYDFLTLEIGLNNELLSLVNVPYADLVKVVAPAAQMIYSKWCEVKTSELCSQKEDQNARSHENTPRLDTPESGCLAASSDNGGRIQNPEG
jgi:hypothetical protein